MIPDRDDTGGGWHPRVEHPSNQWVEIDCPLQKAIQYDSTFFYFLDLHVCGQQYIVRRPASASSEGALSHLKVLNVNF